MAADMDQLGIEHLSVFGLPPVECVNLAADLGCRYISTALTAIAYNPHGYAPFTLRDDAVLRRAMLAAMNDRDVSISLGEGFTIRAERDILELAADVEIMAELGVGRINSVSMDPDRGRSFDQFARLAEMAGAYGMEATVELSPGLTVGDLDTALAALHYVQRPNLRLLIDTMHFVRSGSRAADLAAVDPELIGYVQLSDAPLQPTMTNYMEDAVFERMVPGEGGLPLREILVALPAGVVIGLEVPMRDLAEAGVGPRDRLRRCVEGARGLLAG
jgi:sugar phosphate isomerase/epimerase